MNLHIIPIANLPLHNNIILTPLHRKTASSFATTTRPSVAHSFPLAQQRFTRMPSSTATSTSISLPGSGTTANLTQGSHNAAGGVKALALPKPPVSKPCWCGDDCQVGRYQTWYGSVIGIHADTHPVLHSPLHHHVKYTSEP